MGPKDSSSDPVDAPARRNGSTTQVAGGDDTIDAPPLVDLHGDVLVIRPLGCLDARTIEHVRRIVAESSTAVILDLNQCVLADPSALATIDDTTLGGIEVCIVSGRLTCRQLLARTGAATRFPVFQRRADALQARLLATEGYGRGWTTP